MTLDTYDRLIISVEAGTATPREFGAALIGEDYKGASNAYRALLAYRDEDMNAALSLHEELLGSDWGIDAFNLNGEVVLKRYRPIDRQYGFSDMNPARAWLLAILKAKRSELEADNG